MAQVDNKKLYFCQVMSGNPFQPLTLASSQLQTTSFNVQDTIFFYITTDVSFKSPQSVNVKITPYAAAGKTQNMGRKEIRFVANLLLVDDTTSTAIQKLNKMFLAKNQAKILKVSLPGLPLGNNNYYIDDLNWNVKEPFRIPTTVSFVEVLESNLQINTQNLVLSNSLSNIQILLEQLGIA